MKKQLAVFAALLLLGTATGTAVHAGVFDWPYLRPSHQGQEVSLTVPAGQSLPLSAERLEQELSLKVGALGGITVTKLPDPTEGQLLLNGIPVKAYAPMDRESLSTLVFEPVGEGEATFALIANSPDSVPAVLRVKSASPEKVPQVLDGSITTKEAITIYDRLQVYHDCDNCCKAVVVSKPQKGQLTVEGLQVTYTPYKGQKGTDSFTLAALDASGNRSQEAVYTVQIEEAITGYDYWDMNQSPAYYSAVKLLENDIFAGETVGARRYYSPKNSVTRGQFLMLLVNACGYGENLSQVTVNTGLQNDSELPLYLKPYLSIAKEKGIIKEQRFAHEEIPTLAEAVVMADRASGMPNVTRANPNFLDLQDIPSWALQSYMNLDSYGMLRYADGYAHPQEGLTRENVADLLWQCWLYQRSEK